METILSPKSICSNCVSHNKNSLSWGSQGFVSFACQNIVNVVHVQSMKLVQSLEHHAAVVVKTAWKPPALTYSSTDRPNLWLVSADLSGVVVIWDVVKGTVLSTFQDAKKSIKDLHWVTPSLQGDIILVVHTNVVAAWSYKTQSCSPLWTQPFNDVLQFISLHPLVPSHLGVVGTTSLFIYFNFDCEKEPLDAGNQYLLYSKKGEILRPRYLISPKDERIQSGDLEQCSVKDCLQFSFHPFYRDHGILVFSREIFVFDIEIGMCVSYINLEKHASPFYQAFFCCYSNEFIAVHESGQLSFRQLHLSAGDNVTVSDDSSSSASLNIQNYNPIRYTLVAQTDALRLPRQARPLAAALEPIGERQVSVLMSSGRLFLWRLQPRINSPNLGFALGGLYSGHSGGICCMRIVPGFVSGDLAGYRPLVAIGCQNGSVQIVNLSSGCLEHDFAVSPLPITAIDWGGSKKLVCAGVIGGPSTGVGSSENSQVPIGNTSSVKNELYVISLPAGKVTQLKSSRNDGSAIMSITSSPSGYLAVVIYGSGAVDIWDLETFHVVRSLTIQAAAAQWARRRVNRSASDSDDPRLSPPLPGQSGEQTLAPNTPVSYDELIVVTGSGRLLRFMFVGKSAQEKPLNFDVHVTSGVTAMAWKGRYIIAAELDGKIVIENIIDKRYSTISTNRSSGTSVRRLVFSPGRRNYTFLALFSDGSCDLCNAESGEITNSLRVRNATIDIASGGLVSRAVDADFWAPGIPVIAMTTGAIRILNFDFQFDNCPISARLRRPESLSPYLVADGGRLLTSHRLTAQHTEKSDIENEWPAHWLVPYWPFLEKVDDKAERCALVARILGSEAEYRFWLAVKYYLNASSSNNAGGNQSALPSSLGLLCCDSDFKSHALDSLRRQISLAELPQQRRRIADILGSYGDQESAASALLATQPSDPKFIQDWLKACLIDASAANNTRTATMKLVATNLLADGHIFDGIHLLCLVGLHYDACRYLQTSGFWLDSVKLAKCTLASGPQQVDVVKKFVHNMVAAASVNASTSQRLFAVLLLISVSQFRSAVELLLQFRWTDLAGRLAEAIVDRLGLAAFANGNVSAANSPEPKEKKEDNNNAAADTTGRIQDPILEVATAALARLLADHRLGKQASACASRCSSERHAALLREIELLCNDASTNGN